MTELTNSKKRESEVLSDFDVFGLWTFLAYTFGEGDRLAFFQGFKPGTDDIAEVNEQVCTTVTADETITFTFVEPFNGSAQLVC
jgi:hypothetical protein